MDRRENKSKNSQIKGNPLSPSTKTFTKTLVHPVTLLSVKAGSEENISTMAWVSSVSHTPPMLMVAVNPRRYSHQLLEKTDEFAIIVLSDSQKNLSTLAGTQSGRNIAKWDLQEFNSQRRAASKIDVPVLENSRANLECKLRRQVTAGDHTLFIGEVIHLEFDGDRSPLILYNRQYFGIGEFLADYP
ncbi:MAG: flavin reductase family protein [Calditrichia bacterium]